jgi:hypothetical protein
MPFTAAHPAAILPLLRHSRWFSATGLVVGSISPDFQYFLLLPIFRYSGHTLQGLLFFNLPIALLIATVFHLLVRRPAVAHLPGWLKQRALAVPTLDWLAYLRQRWFVFASSVIIGAATHIFWDAFTHDSGYFVERWPILTHMVPLPLLGRDMMLCRIIQHTSTVVGSLAILAYTWRQPTVVLRQDVSAVQKVVFWAGIAMAGFAFMGYALYASMFMRSLMGVVVSFITGAMLATVAISTALKLSWLRQPRP